MGMRIILILSFVGISVLGIGQNADNWTVLSMVLKESQFDDMMGMDVVKAIPMSPVMELDGQEIEVSGYMIALTAKVEEQSHFMFSRYPQNMCFFCGAAGPESAMQVFMKEGTKLTFQKEKLRIKGVLQVQSNDASGLIYFLHEAQKLD